MNTPMNQLVKKINRVLENGQMVGTGQERQVRLSLGNRKHR